MANEEHLAILRQGVKVWNTWRSENSTIKPDLSRLSFMDGYLNGANLKGVDLSEAELGRVGFLDSNLSQANLSRAHLSDAILIGADLREANVCGAYLGGAILIDSNLSQAKFSGASLSGADLSGADLSEADLQRANLTLARLIESKLDGAYLTDAMLWETQRAGWSIKGVNCDAIYWGQHAIEKTIYAPGEFERLFADNTRLRLFYREGISPLEILTLPSLIQHLGASHPNTNLRFVSIKEDAGGAVVEIAIEGNEGNSQEQIEQLKFALEREAQQRVEFQRQALTERETRWLLQGGIEQLNIVIDKLIHRPSQFVINKGDVMAGKKEGDTYNISGQAGAVGPHAHAHDMTFNQQVNNVEQSIDFSALAKELSELRQAMAAKQDSSPQAAIAIGKVAEAEIAVTERNASKVVEHLKAAGQWTLDFAKSIGKDVVVAAIKKAIGMG